MADQRGRPLALVLERLAEGRTGDEDLEVLLSHVRRIAEDHLHYRCRTQTDKADLAQEVVVKFIEAQGRFQARSEPQFVAYVRVTAERAWIDSFRRSDKAMPADSEWLEQSPEDGVSAEEMLEMQEGRDEISELANEALLGERAARVARPIIALRLLMDGADWQEIHDFLRCNPYKAAPSREELEQWKSDALPLRHIAFQELYKPGVELAKWVLGRGEPLKADVTDLLRRAEAGEGSPPNGWSWPQVKAIIWRFGFGIQVESILSMPNNELDRAELAELCGLCEALFPFVRICEELGGPAGLCAALRRVLASKHVWQRLAFEYRYLDALPVNDVWRRLDAPARNCGAKVTETGVKNAWLGGHRLVEKVRSLHQRELVS